MTKDFNEGLSKRGLPIDDRVCESMTTGARNIGGDEPLSEIIPEPNIKARQKPVVLYLGVILSVIFLSTPIAAQTSVQLIHITGCTTTGFGCRTSSSVFSTLGINIIVPNEGFNENHIISFNARAVVNSSNNGTCQFQVTRTVGGITTVLTETEIGGGQYPAFMRMPVMVEAVNTNVSKTAVTYGVRWRMTVGGICTVLPTVSGTATSGAILTVLRIKQ